MMESEYEINIHLDAGDVKFTVQLEEV